MRELIPKDQYGVFADTKDTARVDSLFVAEFFEKEHKGTSKNTSRASRASKLSLIYSLFLVNFCL